MIHRITLLAVVFGACAALICTASADADAGARHLTVKEARWGARQLARDQAAIFGASERQPRRAWIRSCHKLDRATVACRGTASGAGITCRFRAVAYTTRHGGGALYGYFSSLDCEKPR